MAPLILARSTMAAAPATTPVAAATQPWMVHVPNHWPTEAKTLDWCHVLPPGESALLVLIGIIYLLWGLQLYKILVMLNAAAVGAFLGALLGQFADGMIAGAAVGGFLVAAVTWPLMKHAVAVMGAVFGVFAGGALWIAFGKQPELWWAGGLSGMILFGLMSFIVFRGSISAYTSLQGSVMLILGVLALLTKYPAILKDTKDILSHQPLVGPAAVVIPMIFGMIFQHHNNSAPKTAPVKK